MPLFFSKGKPKALLIKINLQVDDMNTEIILKMVASYQEESKLKNG